jgi:hypothetical protein
LSSFAAFYLQAIYGESATITLEQVTFSANTPGEVLYSLNLRATSALMALLFCPSLQIRIMAPPSPPTVMGVSSRTQPPRAASNALWERLKILQIKRPPHAPNAQKGDLEEAVQLNPAAPTARSVHQVTSAPALAQPVVLHAPQVVMVSSPATPVQTAQHLALKAW